jgi:hypothetical protein
MRGRVVSASVAPVRRLQRRRPWREVLGVGLAALALGPCALVASQAEPPLVASFELERAVMASRVGSTLKLAGVVDRDSGAEPILVLERFTVFTADATITIHYEGGVKATIPAPRNAYFRGAVEGVADSDAFLAVLDDGRVQGIVRNGQTTWLIGDQGAPARVGDRRLAMRRAASLTPGEARFSCGNERLPEPAFQRPRAMVDEAKVVAAATTPAHTVRIAIETDHELFVAPAFGQDPAAIASYVGNLVGYASATSYLPEINTSLVVSSLSLWATPSDPWTQTGTLCALAEFGKVWNATKSGESRTIAHFLSGKALHAGIAWIGVLCEPAFASHLEDFCAIGPETTPWGGAYGFTASIAGAFDADAPTVMWEIVAFAHEVGHNFDSPHTHCYAGLGGNASPIDRCFTSESGGQGDTCNNLTQTWNLRPQCACGDPSLPSAGSTTGGAPGTGAGTIMSYCHQLPGNFGNLTLTFGDGFAMGVLAEREAARMSAHVASIAAGNPSCLAVQPPPPLVGSIAPARGGTLGGTVVTIGGWNFHPPDVTVSFGGAAATVLGSSTTALEVVSPAHASGPVTVVVTNTDDGGSLSVAGGFTYAPTAISAVTPVSGPDVGGTPVTLKGDNFQAGAVVSFSGAGAGPTDVDVLDLQTITLVTPARPTGTSAITVTNSDTTAATRTNGFYFAPEVAATSFYSLTPCRVIDTRRQPPGPLGAPALAAFGNRSFPITSSPCGVPSSAKAISANVTVTAAVALGHLQFYPGNAFALGTSSINFAAGQTRANNGVFVLATDGSGSLGVFTGSSGQVELILDVNGYFE